MYELKVKGHFDAAHRLEGHPGKCKNLHGHRWEVALTVEAEELDELGMAYDFGLIKDILKKRVLDVLDHNCLNDLTPFQKENPTAERIARWVWEECSDAFVETCFLSAVTIWEAPNAMVVYKAPSNK